MLNTDVSIIGVPAIGADPSRTWICANGRPDFQVALRKKIISADILLYDHLTPQERCLEIKPTVDPEHQATTQRFREVKAALARFGTKDWSKRFLEVIQAHRARRVIYFS